MKKSLSQRSSTLFLAIMLAASSFLAGDVLAAPSARIGDAIVIVNEVKADERKLAVGDDVRQDETIAVSADAQSELKLDDDTKIALGPGSKLLLDKFVYDPDKKVGAIVVNLAKGAFRFITGAAAKSSYIVKTPNASITVRGTIFDVFTLRTGSVWVLLHDGAVEVTGAKSGVCRVLDQPGRLMRISETGRVSPSVNWSDLPGKSDVPFETAFPFVNNAPQIDPVPHMSQSEIVQAAFKDQPDKACINPAITPAPIKTRKADGGDKPSPPKKKRNVEQQDDAPKPVKTAKRPRGGDGGYGDDCPGCATGMDVVIGGGIGGFGKGRPSRGDYGGNRGR